MIVRMNDDAFRVSVRRVIAHLPAQNDLTLIVLKGHLLVERVMYDIVRSRRQSPSAVVKAKLSFWKLARLTEGVLGTEAPVWVWTSIDALNQLRNKLVHELEPTEVEREAVAFVDKLNEFGLPVFEGCPRRV
jgi:hypothetical protein